ncbi:exopolysaccharide biosynthesis polyprenyl glycosylphosphotransferase [Roseomonas sp. CECT 9278]|uniref:exopolysaccharide biosynthesis polyprenyl glycosylphosphotransferase n=1 Tax=Roseomonas sp. CECT 9278 TaxID=2845823 RepID=UPI001E4E70B4|nr:exopolysaccharide biosynthesis polyprenyl glycosylphosphotransferase [Roseomonas sp. CECT 9278]CAH0295130.1 UDP-glucose:undecaprenyl-phosphate glucose-1-phosphate transferase [Roseomonas sp. CECT 9278]
MTRGPLAEAEPGLRAIPLLTAAAPTALVRRSVAVLAGLLPAVDGVIAIGAGVAVSQLVDTDGDGEGARHAAATLVGTMFFLALAAAGGQYRADLLDRRIGAVGRLLATWGLALMLTITVAYLWDGGVAVTRGWLVGWSVAGAGALAGWRVLAAMRMRRWRAEGRLAERIAIVGGAEHTQRLVDHLAQPGLAGQVAVLGVYGIDTPEAPGLDSMHRRLADLVHEAPGLGLDAVIVALPWSDPDRIAAVCMQLRDLPVDVRLAPDLAAYDLPAGAPRMMGGRLALEVWGRPLRDWRGFVKRAEDLLVSAGLLVMVAPVMLLAALAIRLDSPGPVLLRQRRFGLGNRPIMIFKFRTMYADRCDATGRLATLRGDPRVTRVGRFLRSSSIDELPQLFNVLLGTMSLVGPRAHPVEMQVGGRYYHEIVRHYAARHRMKPGITGLAQVNGQRGLVDSMEKAQRRLDYDLHYVEHWTLWMDMRILVATLTRGMRCDNAF